MGNEATFNCIASSFQINCYAQKDLYCNCCYLRKISFSQLSTKKQKEKSGKMKHKCNAAFSLRFSLSVAFSLPLFAVSTMLRRLINYQSNGPGKRRTTQGGSDF